MDVKFTSGVSATFLNSRITNSRRGLYGISECAQYALKVELLSNPRKKFDLRGEADIIKLLNDKKCKTCVELVYLTEVSGEDLQTHYPGEVAKALEFYKDQSYAMMITRAYPKMTPVRTQDVAMAIIEQKKLGVWNGDVTIDDTLFDTRENCIKFIDYDQAVLLDDEQIQMGNEEFFDWMDEHASSRFSKYGVRSFTHNLQVSRETHFTPFFDGDCFDIGRTLLFTSQETTLNEQKIYHSFRTKDVYAIGERSLDDRIEHLDKLEFSPGEHVLDVGCNAGLLCHYLSDRGCTVQGIDIDRTVIAGAQILANIVGKPDIEFNCFDLDDGGLIGCFDTVFLFSVIHHTQNLVQNAAQIAKVCNRIVIECRLVERGAKPVEGTWIETSVWRHDSVDDLIAGLEVLFPGFRHNVTLGQGDRDRYIFELKKTETDPL